MRVPKCGVKFVVRDQMGKLLQNSEGNILSWTCQKAAAEAADHRTVQGFVEELVLAPSDPKYDG